MVEVQAPAFHPLKVADIEPLTDEAVAVTFHVPDDLAATFRYLPGQHVTVRAFIDGEDVRRSYSICADANQGVLRIGVKQIPNGVFSSWATTKLQPGETLDVMPPVGEFTITPEPDAGRHYAAIAAGSGITPVLSLISSTLGAEPASRFTLVFGNRTTSSIMFLEELGGLKDRYPDRFHLIHVLSREPQIVPLFDGRIDGDKLDALCGSLIEADSVDAWYLCGPYGMVRTAQAFLAARGVPDDVVHDELFFDEEIPELPVIDDQDTEGFATVMFTLDGRQSVVKVDPEGPPILDHALQVRRELPFACKGGVCATCKARVVEGEVRMDRNFALLAEEVAGGLILTCQSHPVTDKLAIDYDVTGGRA